MPLFNNITIIGLGLIGSSIAQAAKKYHAAKTVTAFDLNQESINKALELGIIDSGYNNLTDSVKDSQMVIICTPISTYEAIINEIAPKLDKNTIITDVGSVKKSVIDIILPKLKYPENFVPAHPIAGSEKSGLLAGNADLFLNKEFIISPAEKSSSSSITKVDRFWQTLGSNIEIIPPEEHDEIYAKSSHIPHLAAFCYARFMMKNQHMPLAKLVENQGDEFAAFVRLAFSNPQMWTDIFLYNKEPIIKNTEKYLLTPSNIIKNNDEITVLYERIKNAANIRAKFQKKGHFTKELNKNDISTGIIPLLISCLLIESVEGNPKVGGGFLGMTQVILNPNEAIKQTIRTQIDEYNDKYNQLLCEYEKLLNYIKSSDKKNIYSYLSEIK
ncbi:MAG: prephenate dehydrogenase/arogenate dehydrogenase family protein [Rickettsiales bacterium]|nr:prephenate dehydrogenase/arogenate dehydrogenase family protein [Pseudomonadota bacterium]MDA0966748.1 prephenate dehydrogenase/arogenate dehydrogenase family protein [Pseudomonadota bacterium]MDG4543420.1 prephenate dehydrogenase/arogenate dehydrogenase family protein [Rickettsiales bacterium]MDG4546186.1 prephenate dehydrogenase/arogenate dehydrogenase family protein [Rickettsiales bacterium]MDG4547659.1 prephenate dehydrogenase/arogenate dehydrogenase family protein [Rickettsiales bacteri